MRAVLGVVSLLVVLAIIGVLASRQLKATRSAPLPAADGAPSLLVTPGDALPAQSRQIQQQVQNEVQAALEQGNERLRQADQ